MKIRKKTVTLAAVLLVCVLLSVFVFAADEAYDSTKDPIAAKSYVDSQVSTLSSKLSTLDAKIAAMESELAELGKLAGVTDELIEADEQQMKKIIDLEAELKILKDQFAELIKMVDALGENNGPSVTYEAIQVEGGKTIYAKGGSLELILRTGTAVVVSPFNDKYTRQGISDNTTGTEIYNGGSVSLNDLLLIPRGDDGRGIKVTSDNAFVMVRGNYEIK